MSLDHAQIVERLEAIENDLGEIGWDFSEAAGAYFRAERNLELRLAQTKLTTKADTQTEKKDKALTAIAAADDDLFRKHAEAQGKYEALRAAVKVLETRATIGMALLKASTRVEPPVSPQGRTYGAVYRG